MMDDRSARVAHQLETPLLVAAVLTVPATIMELSHVGSPWGQIATDVNWVIWVAFLTEVVVMLSVVPSRRHWLRHHVLDLVIVVLTPPVLSAAFQPIRLLRLLRVLRLMRLAPLVRLALSAEGLRYAIILAAVTAFAGGAAFASVENISVGNGVYWAITTMTTVGYGDITPHTPVGKVIAIALMFVGIGTATLVIGAVAQRFVASKVAPELEALEAEEDDLLVQVREIAERLEKLEAALRRQPGS